MLDLEGKGGSQRGFDRILRIGDEESPLALNVLEMGYSEDISEESEIVTRVFTESLGLSPEQSQLLWETFRSIYRQRKTEGRTTRRYAISSIIAEIQRNSDSHGVSSELLTLLRKLVTLAEGKAGEILNKGNSIKVAEILKGTTLIELREVTDLAVRRLLLSLILVSLTQYIKTQASEKKEPRLFLVLKDGGSTLEEDETGRSIMKQSLLDLGMRGIGLLIIQASPRRTPPYIVDLCQTRICHRLANRGDRDLAQKILNLDETQTGLLQELSNKEALVKTPDYALPILAWIPGEVPPATERTEKAPSYEEDLLEIMSETYENEEERC